MYYFSFPQYAEQSYYLFLFFTVPNHCTDEAAGLEHFSRVFHSRFGSHGPILYIGSLDQAIQDSLFVNIHEVNFIISLFSIFKYSF